MNHSGVLKNDGGLKKLQSVYVAFSIHGTNCFIYATKEVEKIEDLGPGFKEVKSRRPDYDRSVGIKLSFDKLNNAKGKPLTNPIAILKVFNDLEKSGWVVQKQHFIQKFWSKRK